VLDEPVAFLDLRHQFEIMQLLAELAREGRGVLATFHDLNHAARWCSRLALLSDGRVAASGAPADVLQEELLRRVYGIALSVIPGVPPAPPRVEFPQ
jgi:iron complex transport system ATP-binding protein